MSKTGLILGSAAMALSLLVSWPALSQSSVDFGDDASRWANDGQCDDPRFEGPGASAVRIAADEGHDATDCRTAFEAGRITLIDLAAAPAQADSRPQSGPAPDGEIDFGDDSGNWANDGECDDPRFGGTLDSHRGADATDCREAYEADPSIYADEGNDTAAPSGEIDFGEDSGSWANDGECDDPRFGGSLDSHRGADATDCREAYDADPSIYVADPAATETGDIDFGDDSGNWANDGECDDPRFGGTLDSHRGADATDCREAYEADPSIYVGEGEVVDIGDIDFGDDSGNWANDGECDDPRFGGTLDSHRGADATDCREAYEADPSIYVGERDAVDIGDIDFGDDSGNWANDGVCDDPRFGGSLESHRGADATDCREAYEAGEVTYVGDTEYPITIDGINFGNDDGAYAFDGECDDPRFEGSGVGAALESHLEADATDCSTAYSEGTVTLKADDSSSQSSGFRINFGDDSGAHPNDGECDDPRFQGRGAAMELYDDNILGDATDCRAAYDAGTVTYVP